MKQPDFAPKTHTCSFDGSKWVKTKVPDPLKGGRPEPETYFETNTDKRLKEYGKISDQIEFITENGLEKCKKRSRRSKPNIRRNNAQACPKCGEFYEIFSCTQCESDITENAFVCTECGKKYVLNLGFDSSFWILSIPFFIIVSATILTILYPISENGPLMNTLEGELNKIYEVKEFGQ